MGTQCNIGGILQERFGKPKSNGKVVDKKAFQKKNKWKELPKKYHVLFVMSCRLTKIGLGFRSKKPKEASLKTSICLMLKGPENVVKKMKLE